MKKILLIAALYLLAVNGAKAELTVPPNANNFKGILGQDKGGTGASSLSSGLLNVLGDTSTVTSNTAATWLSTALNQSSSFDPDYSASFLYALPSGWTFARSGSGWYINASGNLVEATDGVPRFGYDLTYGYELGVYTEPAGTNNALYSSDLTNAVWTATNATVAKDQIGLVGTANTASSVTATANNATVLQSITRASAYSQAAFCLKRITGSGAISITQDNGTTWTSVYPSKQKWTRYLTSPQTIANPVIGIKIATSGDAVAVDCAQSEGQRVTSIIPTTATAVTRNAETLYNSTLSNMSFNATEGTLIVDATANSFLGEQMSVASLGNDAQTRYMWMFFNTDNKAHGQIQGASSYYGTGVGGPPDGSNKIFRIGMIYKSGANLLGYEDGNGSSTYNDPASTFTTAPVLDSADMTRLYLGSRGSSENLRGSIRSISYWKNALPVPVFNQKMPFNKYKLDTKQPTDWVQTAMKACQNLGHSYARCYDALVARSTSACSGPVTISAGGTYSGCWVSTDAATPPVTIDTTDPVIIENSKIAGPSTLIYTSNTSRVIDITVRGTIGFGTDSTPGKFLELGNQVLFDATVDNCVMANVWGMKWDGLSATPKAAVVTNNLGFNIYGSVAHFIQLTNGASAYGSFPNAKIQNNIIINQPFKSNVEDVISLYAVRGTAGNEIDVSNNYILGAYPASAILSSYSGSGIMADNAPQYAKIYSNIVVNAANTGIGVTSGSSNVYVYDNTVVSSGLINGKDYITSSNVGFYDYTTTPLTNYNNRAYYLKPANTPLATAYQVVNDFYFPNCPACYGQQSYLESLVMNPNYVSGGLEIEKQFMYK